MGLHPYLRVTKNIFLNFSREKERNFGEIIEVLREREKWIRSRF